MTTTPRKKKLLVTGASGFLGWNLCTVARETYEVHGVCNTHSLQVDGTVFHHADLCNTEELTHLFSVSNPDIIIHTAAAADPNYCQNNPEVSRQINVHASTRLAELCAVRHIPFVFTSSDLVFDGTQAPYTEDASVCPVSLYGRQKVEAEQRILEAYPAAAVCRMPLMYGDTPPHAKSFIQPMITAILAPTSLRLFTDEFRTPCSAVDAAHGLLLAAENFSGGILHLGGPERLSRFEIGAVLGKALNRSPQISALQQCEVTMAAPRPADVSLDITRAQHTLGFTPGTMAERLPGLSIIIRSRL